MKKMRNGYVVDMTPEEMEAVRTADRQPAEPTAEERIAALEKAVFSVLKKLGL